VDQRSNLFCLRKPTVEGTVTYEHTPFQTFLQISCHLDAVCLNYYKRISINDWDESRARAVLVFSRFSEEDKEWVVLLNLTERRQSQNRTNPFNELNPAYCCSASEIPVRGGATERRCANRNLAVPPWLRGFLFSGSAAVTRIQ
jgi:hypothetical protein